MNVEYKPGYRIDHRVIEKSQRQNPAVDLLLISIIVRQIMDVDNYVAGFQNDPLEWTNHRFEYIWYPSKRLPHGDGGLYTMSEPGWTGPEMYPNMPPRLPLATVEEAIYDCVMRFELHECAEFLKIDGEHVVSPH